MRGARDSVSVVTMAAKAWKKSFFFYPLTAVRGSAGAGLSNCSLR